MPFKYRVVLTVELKDEEQPWPESDVKQGVRNALVIAKPVGIADVEIHHAKRLIDNVPFEKRYDLAHCNYALASTLLAYFLCQVTNLPEGRSRVTVFSEADEKLVLKELEKFGVEYTETLPAIAK